MQTFKPGTLRNGTERNGTEPEVIDAQYGRGHRIRVGKMYGELISRSVPATKTGQSPSRKYRAAPSLLNILAVYLVSLSGVADPSLTSEGSAMPLPSQLWGVELPVAHPEIGREWYCVLYSPQVRNKHHHRASAFMLTSGKLGQLLAKP